MKVERRGARERREGAVGEGQGALGKGERRTWGGGELS